MTLFEEKPIPPDIQREIERNLRAGGMTLWEKLVIALINLTLFTLGLGVLLLLFAIFLSGCAHQPPVIQATAIEKITLVGILPGTVTICIEDPDRNWATPDEARTYSRTVCVSLDHLRHLVAHVREAE